MPSSTLLESFGGLDLSTDPGELGANGAIDLANVDFDRLGRVRSRSGYVKHTLTEGTNFYDGLHAFHRAGAADTILAAGGTRLSSIIDGAISTTVTGTASGWRFAAYGTATENRVYCANGADTVRYYKHDEFTTPTYTGTTPTGRFVAVQQPDNRLVIARTAANPSRVMFSDPGDPATFAANNYVDLAPGDGEEITEMVAWREYVFVFKETKCFVFYGNDTDTAGDPIFNNRAIPGGGVRLGHGAVAGADGVYFLDRRGVYKTTGGNPVWLSRPVAPVFAPVSSPSSLQLAPGSTPTLSWADDRLYLCYATVGSATNNRMLVFHATDGWWSMWTIPASAVTAVRTHADDTLSERLMFGLAAGSRHIGKLTDAVTDDGAPIDSFYQFGFMDFGDAGRKVLGGVVLDGTGRVGVSVATDYGAAGAVETVNLSSRGTVGRGRARTAYRGRNFSPRVESVAGSSWEINRLALQQRSKQPVGIGG